MDEIILELKNVHTYYGNIEILKGVSFQIRAGEIVTLIGANGAGKTTTLKTICGINPAERGTITFREKQINNVKPDAIMKMGVSMVPEGRRIFSRMTVLENLELGGYIETNQEVKKNLERIFGMFPVLGERKKQVAGTLSGGEQQMLAIGRALMSRPKLLLLDEPSLGLAPKLVDQIFSTITEINNTGITVLLVEQNAQKALQISSRGYIVETGKITIEDFSNNLLNNPAVKEAYLGD